MISARFIYLSILIWFTSVPAYSDAPSPQETGETKPSQKVEHPKILLKQYLVEEGEKLGCYFTIEDDAKGDTPVQFSDINVLDQDSDTIDHLVDSLKQQVPNAIFERSIKNPKVIHIVASSLDQDKNYVMNQNLNFTYIGVLGMLPQRLDEHTDSHIGPRPFFYEGEASDDAITSVTIKAKNTSVRNILTDYVPLSNYHRIIWTSLTKHAAGKLDTWVQYDGPIQHYGHERH